MRVKTIYPSKRNSLNSFGSYFKDTKWERKMKNL
jgi:hypothetical protein